MIAFFKWYTYFRSLNKIPEKYKTKIEEINKIVENMENSPTFCELDYKITSSEIMKAISKLKSFRTPLAPVVLTEVKITFPTPY